MSAPKAPTMAPVMAALERRVRLMVGRAILSLVKDSSQLQELQVELLAGESQDGVEHFQPYGMAAHPHPGAEVVMAFAGGLRSHALALAVADRRYRLTSLQQGEVALYDDLGNQVLLGRSGIVVTAVTRVSVTAPEANITADQVTIESDNVRLGGAGGAAVARVGDDVDPGTHKIISGSSKVTAT